MITAATRLAAVWGHPVRHSVSPQIHNAAFAAMGIDAVYVALQVDPDQVAAALAGIRAYGLLGVNTTLPHKQAVYAAVPRRTPDADAVRAANTVYWDDGELAVDNTDIGALTRIFGDDVTLAPAEPVVLFGTGAAARAAAAVLGRLGATVEVVGRRPAEVAGTQRLVRDCGGTATTVGEARLVVNATPLGLRGEPLPERFMHLRPGQVAFDMLYGRAPTPFLAAAAAAGAAAIDGLGMLVEQAALSFARWTGLQPPRQTMAAAAAAALRGG